MALCLSVLYFEVLSKILLGESVSRLKPPPTLQLTAETISKSVSPNSDFILLAVLKIDTHLQLELNHK